VIFVTVGAQMPFDRLVRWVDDWAGETGRDDVRAQIGPSDLAPRHLTVVPFLDPQAFRREVERADAVIAHAGMGTILTTLEIGRPILVVPRLGARGETRNDHQVATARHFAGEGLVRAAYDEAGFREEAARLLEAEPAARIGSRASEGLLERVRGFALG
jgi:UDP-N-acetylglucosamine transferase subunit ALG13